MDDCRNGEQNTILADVQWLYEHRLAIRHLAWVKTGHSNSRIPQHDSRINTYSIARIIFKVVSQFFAKEK